MKAGGTNSSGASAIEASPASAAVNSGAATTGPATGPWVPPDHALGTPYRGLGKRPESMLARVSRSSKRRTGERVGWLPAA